MMANDKIIENLSEKTDSFISAMKNQLSFKKMLETQLAQLAAAVPSFEQGKILGKPEDPIEGVKLVSTRFGKPLVGPTRVISLTHYSSPRGTIQATQPSPMTLDHKSSITTSVTLDRVSTSWPR